MAMTSNERGGIVSSVLIIPVGVVVIITVFLLGYYVGKNRATQDAAAERPPALPEVTSPAQNEKEEYTFYKTLTEKGDKTLSIELKTRPHETPAPAASAEQRSEAGKARTAGAEKQGTAKQEPKQQQTAKAAPVQKRETPAPKQTSSKIRYTIQIGAYPERSLAEDEVRAIKKKGYAAFIVASAIPDKGTWFRVRIGSFSNKQSAEKLAAELRSKEGVSSFITVE